MLSVVTQPVDETGNSITCKIYTGVQVVDLFDRDDLLWCVHTIYGHAEKDHDK